MTSGDPWATSSLRSVSFGPHSILGKKKMLQLRCPHLKIGRVPLKKSGFPFSNNNNKSKHFCVARYVPGALLNDLCHFAPLILRTILRHRPCLCYQPPPTAGETEAGGDPGCSWLCTCPLGAGHTPSTRPAAPGCVRARLGLGIHPPLALLLLAVYVPAWGWAYTLHSPWP